MPSYYTRHVYSGGRAEEINEGTMITLEEYYNGVEGSVCMGGSHSYTLEECESEQHLQRQGCLGEYRYSAFWADYDW